MTPEVFKDIQAKATEDLEFIVRCELCDSMVVMASTVSLSCSHSPCRECFDRYINYLVETRRVAPDLFICPFQACESELDSGNIRNLIDEALYEKYERFSLEDFA